MVEAGWYDDPQTPEQLRYWDGQTWTDHVAPSATPPVAPGAAPEPGVPWSPSGPGVLAGVGAGSGEYRAPGQLISSSFANVWSSKWGAAALMIGIPLAGSLVLGILAMVLLGSSIDDPTAVGPVRMIILFLAYLALIVLIMASTLGVSHFLYWQERGEPSTVGQSLARGLRRLPALIGISILISLGLVAVMLAAALIIGLGSMIGDAVVGLLALVVGIASLVGYVWFVVKMAFLQTTVAVAPKGTPLFSAAKSISDGRFWPTLGRLMLLGLVGFGIVIIPIAIAGSIMASAVATIDDPTQAAGGFSIGLLLAFLLYIGSMLVASLMMSSGIASMYLDRRGPAAAGPAV